MGKRMHGSRKEGRAIDGWLLIAFLSSSIVLLYGCGGSSGGAPESDTLSSKTTGIEVPESVQTVPSDSSSGKPSFVSGYSKPSSTGHGNLGATDYANDSFELKVSIHAIEQFSIIETVLKAIKETSYYDSRVVNQGPYGALVTFDEDNGNGKRLEKWIVDSKMILESGKDVNKIHAWIDEPDDLVKAQFKIYTAPTVANIYGEWRLDVGFFSKATGLQTGTFVASCSLNTTSGETELMVNADMENSGMAPLREVLQGKLFLKNDTGKGIIKFTDWGNMGIPTVKVARYAYDANHVIVQVESNPEVVFSRTSYKDIYLEYELYTSAGDNVRKSKNFGKPVKYTDANNNTYFMYYGGWMGRHQLWGPNTVTSTIAEGATLTGAGQANDGQTYTLAKKYMGYLVEKTLVNATLTEIKGENLQTWINQGFQLKWTGAQWEKTTDPPVGNNTDGIAYDTSFLFNDPQNHKFVMIFKGPQPLSVDAGGNFNGYVPVLNDLIWVNLSMPIFLTYDGANWQQYNTVSWDGFEPAVSNPAPYNGTGQFTMDGTFYLNSKGLNYILTVSGGQALYTLKKELENVIQPGSEAAAIDGRTFTGQDNRTYTFDWNPADESITLYDDNGLSYTQSIWYMTSAADPTKTYMWQYAENANQTWNIMVYLKDSQGNWVFLDDPVKFASINIGGKDLNALAYDGHLFGVPDVWRMLEQSNWQLTQDQKDKVINIPEGTVLTDAADASITYLIKPRFGVRILDTVLNGYVVVIDASLTFDGLPTYQDPGIGDLPAINDVTVQEGVFLTP